VTQARRRPRVSGRAVFSGAIAVLAAWALVQTLHWPIKTALYPRAVAIPLLLLAAAETVLNLIRSDETNDREAMDTMVSTEVPADVAVRRTVAIAGWMIGFYLAILLVGFPRAVPVFVFAYLKVYAKERWTLSLILAALAWLGFHLLFIRLLHLPFPDGLLWRLISP
jgi:putative tricarboxylic transport membrane protein